MNTNPSANAIDSSNSGGSQPQLPASYPDLLSVPGIQMQMNVMSGCDAIGFSLLHFMIAFAFVFILFNW